MKLRGTLGGLNLLLESADTPASVHQGLAERRALMRPAPGQPPAQITLELGGELDVGVLEAALEGVRAAGAQPGRVKGARPAPAAAEAAPASSAGASGPREQAGPPQRVAAAPPGQQRPDEHGTRTVVLQHGLRSGFRGEYRGSVVVLGDVNPGAEIVAGGDVIVLGALRGVVHAGAAGRDDAIVYARPIASAQIRIAGALARAPEEHALGSMRRMEAGAEAELARLIGGVIQIESHTSQRG